MRNGEMLSSDYSDNYSVLFTPRRFAIFQGVITVEMMLTILDCLAPIWLIGGLVFVFKPNWIITKKDAPVTAEKTVRKLGYLFLGISLLLFVNVLF